MSRSVDPQAVRESVLAVWAWLGDPDAPTPDRAAVAAAVRLTARVLAASAPGTSVEVRIPPFVAVQCISGPSHSRGTPSNVVETDPRTWLLLAVGRLDVTAAVADGRLSISGSRAGAVAELFPLVRIAAEEPGDTSEIQFPL